MKFKVGDRVKPKEDHVYLKVTRRNIGRVVSFNAYAGTGEVGVKFRNRDTETVFQADELKKVK